jgi:cell division protein FtsL
VTVYRIFQRAGGPAAVRGLVIAMIATACVLSALAIVRVARQHEVLQLGYQLSREADRVRELRETRRRLELEYATLTAPERIRRLASQLGMQPVAPDHIRVIASRDSLPASSTAKGGAVGIASRDSLPASTTAKASGVLIDVSSPRKVASQP